jgi:hypothetical protein
MRSFLQRSHTNMFKTFTMLWWQAALFKLGMLSLGIAIGVHWHLFFSAYLQLLLVVAVGALGYITYVWYRQ